MLAGLVGGAPVGGRWLEGARGVGRWPSISGMLSGQRTPAIFLLEDLRVQRVLKSYSGFERKRNV